MRNIPDHIRRDYPEIVAYEEKRAGDPKLRKRIDELGEKQRPIRNALENYDEECERGILHTPEYDAKMARYRKELAKLEKETVAAIDAYNANRPEYDADNHIGGCGCVVKNGERVYWCGDHY